MKFELDLFGQVPIKRLELKRKLKTNEDLTVEAAIKEIVAQRLERSFTVSPKYKRLRRFNSPQEKICSETLGKYLAICQSKTAYRAYLAKIKNEVKRNVKADKRFGESIERLQHLEQLQQEAYVVIAQLSGSSTTQDRLIAKRKGKQYQPRKKTLIVKHVKLFKKAEIDVSLIPWEFATLAAQELGKNLGIYKKPEMMYNATNTKFAA